MGSTAQGSSAPGAAEPLGWRRLVLLAEAPIVLALTAAALFPGSRTLVPLLVVPLLWLARRAALGRFTVTTGYELPVLLLLLSLPVALINVVDWGRALPKLQGILLGVALVYAVANGLATPRRLVAGAYAVILLFGVAVAAIGAVGTEWDSPGRSAIDALVPRPPPLIRGVVPGTASGAINPNEVGGALAAVLPLAVAAAVATVGAGSRAVVARLVAVAAAVFVVLVLVLTESRAAYAGAAVGVAVVLLWSIARAYRPATLLGLAAALLALGLLAWTVARTALTPGDGELVARQTITLRAHLWLRSWYMVEDSGLTGVGLGQFPHAFARYASYSFDVERLTLGPLTVRLPPLTATVLEVLKQDPPHAHNWLLQNVLDLGLVGAAAVLWLVALCLVHCVRAARRRVGTPWVAAGVAGGMTSFMVYGLLDTIALGARGGVWFWALLGLAAAQARGCGGGPGSPSARADGQGGVEPPAEPSAVGRS